MCLVFYSDDFDIVVGINLVFRWNFHGSAFDFPLWGLHRLFWLRFRHFLSWIGGLKTIAYTNVFQMLLLIGVSILLVRDARVHRVGGIGKVLEAKHLLPLLEIVSTLER